MRKPFLPFTLLVLAGCLYVLSGSEPVSPLPVDPVAAQVSALAAQATHISADPAHLAVMMLGNQPETCVKNGALYTSYPPKCLSTKGRLMWADGQPSQQVFILPGK